jgi:hypothetical protein
MDSGNGNAMATTMDGQQHNGNKGNGDERCDSNSNSPMARVMATAATEGATAL